MKIYFASSNNNNSNHQKMIHAMINDIKRFGQILIPWKTDQVLMVKRIPNPNQQIHDHSVRQLEIADALVAEISQPSLGVGYELCLAEQLDLPTIVLYNSKYNKPSPIITGARKFNVNPYYKWQQAKQIINNFLNEFK